ncbi:MAG TPA: hypothetical protein PK453_10585 [Leptospiraceae bacterium]|nr:hypothetical protein [Leptospiraceae bacterium]
MKKIILLLLFPVLFLSSETRKEKKKTIHHSKKETKVISKVNEENSQTRASKSQKNLKSEIVSFGRSGDSNGLLAKIVRDKYDRLLELQFLKKENEKYLPSMNEGISKILYKINDKEYRENSFDLKGKPVSETHFKILPDGWEIKKISGKDIRRHLYDGRGIEVQSEKFESNGTLNERTEYKYDEHCLNTNRFFSCRTVTEIYGADGKLKNDYSGTARTVNKYDQNCLNKTDPAGLELIELNCRALMDEYSSEGKRLRARLFTYDDKGNFLYGEEIGTDGKIINRLQPFFYKFDEKGNLIQKETGREMAKEIGYMRQVYEYDQNCLNTGKPSSHCISLEETYDADGKPKELGFFSSEPFRMVYKYDMKGNKILQESYGADGRLIQAINGNIIARKVFKYDEKGNLIEVENYGSDEKLVTADPAAARTVYKYDNNCILAGNQSKDCKNLEEFYGADGKLTVSFFNLSARIIYNFDENGNRTKIEYFGPDGKLKDNDEGFARKISKYDSNGNNLSSRYINVSGSVVRMELFQIFPHPFLSGKILKLKLDMDRFFRMEDVIQEASKIK